MKKVKFYFSFISILLIVVSCATIYHAPSSYETARTHTKIAIIPPKVSLVDNKKSVDVLKQDALNLTGQIQNDLSAYFQKRNSKKFEHRIEIESVETTNNILEKNDYLNKNFSNEEMCKLLNVDAVVTSKFVLEKRFSDATSILVYLCTAGMYPLSNKTIKATVTLHDSKSNKLIWSYDSSVSGTGFSSFSSLSASLASSLTKKTPYSKKK